LKTIGYSVGIPVVATLLYAASDPNYFGDSQEPFFGSD